MKFLLYGAYGYTGLIILERAKNLGLEPVIAGRDKAKLEDLAKKYNVEYVAFDLEVRQIVVDQIKGFNVVLNCAGPFSQTARPMVKACMEVGAHYLDITGEIEVFEWMKSQDKAAQYAGICLVPGVGFDVVPTDCLAGFLHKRMPDATHLTLAFAPIHGQISHGTATTMVENMGSSGAVRKEGKIMPVALGHKSQIFQMGEKEVFMMTIPWGDISTAYTTTKIPNIEVYTTSSKRTFFLLKFQFLYNWFLRTSLAKNLVQHKIDNKIPGVDADARTKGKTLVLGIVRNAKGDEMQALLSTIEAYEFTAHSALNAVKRIMTEDFKSGYYTPSLLFGDQFAEQVEGTTLILQ